MAGFMVLVTGACAAIAFYHLAMMVVRFEPSFDRATVEAIGIPRAFLAYMLAGPVLLVIAWSEARMREPGTSARLLLPLAIVWTAALGIAAVESGRALL